MSTPIQPVSRLAQRMHLPPEPPPGAVISWQQQFTPDGPVYSYVAIHVPGRGWFVSDDSEAPYSWLDLAYWLIGQAPVFTATSWQQVA